MSSFHQNFKGPLIKFEVRFQYTTILIVHFGRFLFRPNLMSLLSETHLASREISQVSSAFYLGIKTSGFFPLLSKFDEVTQNFSLNYPIFCAFLRFCVSRNVELSIEKTLLRHFDGELKQLEMKKKISVGIEVR